MILRKFVPLAGVLVAAVTLASPALAARQSPAPVPSLTPAKTTLLWKQLVAHPRSLVLAPTAVCSPNARTVFYAATDWLRLATKLAANPAQCTDYFISVPPLTADKTQFRTDQAWRIRALGPQFHALAEVNVTGWTGWVSTNGGSWYAAGQEARRRLAAAGYDVAAGDTWVVNELSSAVRQGVGSARANMRSFLRGLYEGDGVTARGAVFIAGIGQPTTELSVYQSRLQDWYEDAPFWDDMSRYVSDWSQELYGDVRTWAVPGADPATRAGSLNEYLQHEVLLARVAPGPGAAAASFLAAAYSPLANAAWAYDAAFGWTNVPSDLMQSYVSSQVSALRSAGGAGFGFAWSPKNLQALATADFNAQTDAILERLAAGIAGPDACAPSWCGGDLDGAAFNPGWQTFAAWKPAVLAFTTSPQTIASGTPSAELTVQLQTNTGVAYTAGVPLPVTLGSSSAAGSFSTSAAGPWTSALTVEIPSGAAGVSVYYRDVQSGSPAITASAAGKAAATQVETVAPPADTTPPETTITAGPSGTVTAADATFTFSSEAGASFACRLDAGPWSSCTSPKSYAALPSGTHTFEVRAADAAGNADPDPATRTWTIQPATSGSNDAFADAQSITGTSGNTTGSSTGATKETGEPAHNGNPGGKSIWYRWTAPSTGTATVDTIGSSFDTVLAVYTGSTLGGLAKVASDDDSGGSYTSKVTFGAVAGTIYQIAVDGYNGASGSVKLAWALAAAPAGPPNDLFASAQALSGTSGSVTGGNAGASKEAGEPAHAGNGGGKSIWYRWTAPSTGTATVDTIGSSFDTVLAVYTGPVVSALARIASNDDSGGVRTSKVAFGAVAGTTYQIAVDGYNGAAGSVKLNWRR